MRSLSLPALQPLAWIDLALLGWWAATTAWRRPWSDRRHSRTAPYRWTILNSSPRAVSSTLAS